MNEKYREEINLKRVIREICSYMTKINNLNPLISLWSWWKMSLSCCSQCLHIAWSNCLSFSIFHSYYQFAYFHQVPKNGWPHYPRQTIAILLDFINVLISFLLKLWVYPQHHFTTFHLITKYGFCLSCSIGDTLIFPYWALVILIYKFWWNVCSFLKI